MRIIAENRAGFNPRLERQLTQLDFARHNAQYFLNQHHQFLQQAQEAYQRHLAAQAECAELSRLVAAALAEAEAVLA